MLFISNFQFQPNRNSNPNPNEKQISRPKKIRINTYKYFLENNTIYFYFLFLHCLSNQTTATTFQIQKKFSCTYYFVVSGAVNRFIEFEMQSISRSSWVDVMSTAVGLVSCWNAICRNCFLFCPTCFLNCCYICRYTIRH